MSRANRMHGGRRKECCERARRVFPASAGRYDGRGKAAQSGFEKAVASHADRTRSRFDRARHDDRRRYLHDDRHGRQRCGPGRHRLVPARGSHVVLRGALLRRARRDGADRRERVHLYICDARQARPLGSSASRCSSNTASARPRSRNSSAAAIQDAVKTFGVSLPAWAQQSNLVMHGAWWRIDQIDFSHSQYDVTAAVFVLVLSTLLSIGIRESASANNMFVVLKISALFVFIIAGITLFHAANLHDFNPHGWGSISPFGGSVEADQPDRHHSDFRVRLLQLHRFRYGDDDGRGVRESATRLAARHHRRARHRNVDLLCDRDRARRRRTVVARPRKKIRCSSRWLRSINRFSHGSSRSASWPVRRASR